MIPKGPRAAASVWAIADDLAGRAGLRALGDSWERLPPDEAARSLSIAIGSDLCTERDLVDAARSTELSTLFLSSFVPGATLLTNGALARSRGICWWTPLTDGVFDTGVVVVDDRAAGLLWIEDPLNDDAGHPRPPWGLPGNPFALEERLRHVLRGLDEEHPLRRTTAVAVAGRGDLDATLFTLRGAARTALIVDLW